MTGAPSRPQRQVRLPLHIIDLVADELRSNSGEHVDFRPRSYVMLRLLAENAGRLVTKDAIIATVWDDVAVTEIFSPNASPIFAEPLATTTGACCAPSRAKVISWSHHNAERSSPAGCLASSRRPSPTNAIARYVNRIRPDARSAPRRCRIHSCRPALSRFARKCSRSSASL